MEYFRDPNNQIYADIAYRLLRIMTQYEEMDTKVEKFEATLYLTVLQNLMTNCNEYIRRMTRSARKNSIFDKDISNLEWGINNDCWINTFKESPTLQNFITRIRNSVSHPTITDINSKFPSTGFTTIKIKNKSEVIEKFIFINSPDTQNNRQKELDKKQLYETIYQRNSNNEIINKEFPEGITYRESPTTEGKFQLILNGKPFIRISIIELYVEQLGKFVKKLANYLAQPIQKNWDGETIKDLIAA